MSLSRNLGYALMLGLGVALGLGLAQLRGPGGLKPEQAEALLRQGDNLERRLARLEASLVQAGQGREASARPVPSPVAVDEQALRAVVAQVLREELGTLTESVAEKPPAPPPAASPASLARSQEAHRLLDLAQSQGQWTEEHAEALGKMMHELTDGQREELLQRLVLAVNRGELRPQGSRLLR